MSNSVKPGPVVRPGILEIAAYVGGESKVEGVDRVIRLASNEGALGPSPKAVAAYQSIATEIHRYPDGHSGALRQAIAEAYDLDPARIVCGTGSDEIITLLARIYAGPGDEVLYSQHGFLMYPIAAKSVGATPVAAPEVNLTANVDALLAAVTPRTTPPGPISQRARSSACTEGFPPISCSRLMLLMPNTSLKTITKPAWLW